jgi:hypothetical protein
MSKGQLIMALTINYLKDRGKDMRTNRRLYIDTTGNRIVTEDTPEDCDRLFKIFGEEVTQAEFDKWKGQIEKYIQGYQKPKKKTKKSKPGNDKKLEPESDK